MKVYVIVKKSDCMILGCFDSYEKAEKYISNNQNVLIVELSVL